MKQQQNKILGELIIEEKDILLNDLYKIEHLSVRVYNACQINGLTSLQIILQYYLKFETFVDLKNCGKKTEFELIELCKKYHTPDPYLNIEKETPNKSLMNKINTLSPIQRKIFDRHFEYLMTKMSVRTYNGFRKICTLNKTNEIIEILFSNDFHFLNVEFIGTKSLEEIENLKLEIIGFIELLLNVKQEEFCMKYAKFVVTTTFSKFTDNFEKQFKEVFDANTKLKLFKFINLLINSSMKFSEHENEVFKLIYTNEYKVSKSIILVANKFKLTRERSRQIKVILVNNIRDYFLFVSNFTTDGIVNYLIDSTNDFHIIDLDLAKKINKNENVDFNLSFYSKILAVLLSDTHTMLGNIDVIIEYRRLRDKWKYKNCYLIKTTLFENFDFPQLVDDIFFKLSTKISDSYSLNYNDFLSKYFVKEGKPFFEEIKLICCSILLKEFGLTPDNRGFLKFERNTRKLNHQYLIEILEENNRLMTVKEITEIAKERFPILRAKITSIRGILNLKKQIFISFGRSSTYGLSKWEKENERIKGGSIRKIVEEFLQNEESPKHYSEIYKYVSKYRNTTSQNILSNLMFDKSGRFIFYRGAFVGLRDKNYDSNSINSLRLNGSQFTKKYLRKFVNWEINEVVSFYVNHYGYKAVQIENALQNKFDEGMLKLSEENRIIL